MSADTFTHFERDAAAYDRGLAEPDFDLPSADDVTAGDECWHCHGYGVVPTGRHDHNGDDIERQCGACDGWGQR